MGTIAETLIAEGKIAGIAEGKLEGIAEGEARGELRAWRGRLFDRWSVVSVF